MFKQIVTLVRARVHDTAEEITEANALSILRQQIRDCAVAIDAARRSAALATAQLDQEARHHAGLIEQISRLESRTMSAMEQGKTELAREGAEVIARLENDRDASEIAQRSFNSEIARLKLTIRASETRLRELERGQRLAVAAQNTLRLRQSRTPVPTSTLREAEETLGKLRARQKLEEVSESALADMEVAWCPHGLEDRLAEAGCGPAISARTEDVLARLRERIESPSDNA
jgi:phage shock protein A